MFKVGVDMRVLKPQLLGVYNAVLDEIDKLQYMKNTVSFRSEFFNYCCSEIDRREKSLKYIWERYSVEV